MTFNNVTVEEAFAACQKTNHLILDVRAHQEWFQGVASGSVLLSLNELQAKAISQLDKNTSYYVICQIGERSKKAIEILNQLGFNKLFHIFQGFGEWQKQKLPIEHPQINPDEVRYSRHYMLQGFGKVAQDKLKEAHVLMIGAGGLSSSCALYLAAVGVGKITIVDDDKVELSNLQRQIIHSTSSIGSLKVESAKYRLNDLNPEIFVEAVSERITGQNVDKLIKNCDIVIDGSDNLSTRYLVNDVCLKYSKLLIYSAVYQYEAQLTVFDFRISDAPCLRCLFPQTEGFEPENCTDVGVLGVVPGLAGVMQATEAIKLITGIGEVLQNQMLTIDLLSSDFRKISYKKSVRCEGH